MPADEKPKKLKIFVFNQRDLRTEGLKHVVTHFSDRDQLRQALNNDRNCQLVLSCKSTDVQKLEKIFSEYFFDALYIVNLDQSVRGTSAPWWNKVTMVMNDQEMMRRLCTQAALSFFNQGHQYRSCGDHGLANLSFDDSLRALDLAALFI